MKKKVNELEVATDIDTLNKVRGKLKPTDKVDITDKPKPGVATSTTSSSSLSMADAMTEEVIEPKDKATIKYLSNVKDSKSGEVSKPFDIGGKKYQMVRCTSPTNEIVMGVYSHDDLNENGENIIHPLEDFETNIVKPFHESMNKGAGTSGGYDHAAAEREFTDKESFIDYLNLTDLVGYKHFFVNTQTGEVVAKFKSTSEMIRSGVKLGPNEDYMDAKALKRFRFGDYFKPELKEESPMSPQDAGTNIPKLQADVKKLTALIKNKFSIYLSKLDKPIEQAQFLTAMAAEIGVPLNKLSTIIASYRDISQNGQMDKIQPGLTAENRVITKNQLIEGLTKKVIKTIKVKDIK